MSRQFFAFLVGLCLVACGSSDSIEVTQQAAFAEQATNNCDWELFEAEDERGRELYGYRDSQGTAVISPRYIYANDFDDDGIAAVILGDAPTGEYFGYLNCQGQFLPVKDHDNGPDDFRDGLVRIVKDGLIGFADRNFQIVISPQFEMAAAFCQGLAEVSAGCSTHFDGDHHLTSCNESYYIDRSGKRVKKPDEEPQCYDW